MKIETITALQFLVEIELCKEFNLAISSVFDDRVGLRVIDGNGDEKYYTSPDYGDSPQGLADENVFMANLKQTLDANEDKYATVIKWDPIERRGD